MHLISSRRGQHSKPTTSTDHGTQEASLWTAELKNTLRTKSRASVPDPMWISCVTWRRHFIVWASVPPTLKAARSQRDQVAWHREGEDRQTWVQVPWVLVPPEFYNFRQMASFLWISISSYPLKKMLPPTPTPNFTGFGANKEAHLRNPWQRQICMSISRFWVTGVHLVNLSTVLFTCLSVLLESKVLKGRASLSIFLHLIKK